MKNKFLEIYDSKLRRNSFEMSSLNMLNISMLKINLFHPSFLMTFTFYHTPTILFAIVICFLIFIQTIFQILSHVNNWFMPV